MTPQKISARLVIALAVIAAVVATGLIAGYVMQPWIVAYWVVLTAKNIVDYIGVSPSAKRKMPESDTVVADLQEAYDLLTYDDEANMTQDMQTIAEAIRKAIEACRQYRMKYVYGKSCVIHEEDF